MIFRCVLDVDKLALIPKSTVNSALHELLRAYKLGLHLLVFSREVARYFMENADVNLEQQNLLKRIFDEYTQNGQIHLAANAYCDIVDIENPLPFGQSLLLPFSSIDANLVGQATYLVLENAENDGFIYDFVFNTLSKALNIPRCNVTYEHGGGSTTKEIFKKRVKEGRLVVCILDTDKDVFFSKDPPKIREFSAISAQSFSSHFCLLPCREIENILPTSVVGKLQCATQCVWPGYADIIASSDGNDLFWLYLDLKEGLSSEKLSKFDPSTNSWLASRLSLCGINTSGFSHCGCGDNVVSVLRRNGLALSDFRTSIRGTRWRSHFEYFFSDVAWWFASSPAVRT